MLNTLSLTEVKTVIYGRPPLPPSILPSLPHKVVEQAAKHLPNIENIEGFS